MAEDHITIDRFDARLDKARKLLTPKAKPKASLKEALLSSMAFAATALMLATAIILGPGWEQAPSVTAQNDASAKVKPADVPKAMMVQTPSEGFELSATPLPADGINEAVPLSEDELSAGIGAK